MPTLSTFYGILIRMFWQEHNPPHFHAVYGDAEVTINIVTLKILKGSLPHRALALVLEWAVMHKEELMEAWHTCSNNQQPQPIDPLD